MIDTQFINKIVKNLPSIIENGPSEESEVLLKKIGLCSEHIKEVFELINDAYGRASLYASGMKPGQFSGDLDENSIFIEAVKLFLARSA